jgi:hypothetical protein
MRVARLLPGLAVALVAAGCGEPEGATLDRPLADTAVVACNDEGTLVEEAAVRTHPDGVHFRVQNPADEERMLLIHWHGSDQVSHGTLELTRPVPPGEVRLACVGPEEPPAGELDEEGGLYWPYPQDDEWVVLHVVDRDGYWTDDTLTCEDQTGWHNDYPWDFSDEPVPPGDSGDLVDLARRDLPRELGTVEPGDVVEPAGYSGVPRDVRLVRDGETVANIWYRSDGQGGWHLGGVDYCDGPWESAGPEPAHDDEDPVDVEQ